MEIFFDRFDQPKSIKKQEPNLVTYNCVGPVTQRESMVTATVMVRAFTESERLTSPPDSWSHQA